MRFKSLQNLKDYAKISGLSLPEKTFEKLDEKYLLGIPPNTGIFQIFNTSKYGITAIPANFKKKNYIEYDLSEKRGHYYNRVPDNATNGCLNISNVAYFSHILPTKEEISAILAFDKSLIAFPGST